jgi:4-methylaminobutanoate oxidase (formaldehyde-forming)
MSTWSESGEQPGPASRYLTKRGSRSFWFVGPDALAALQHVCAADVDLDVGGIVPSLALADDGTLRADFVVLRLAEAEFLVMSGTG